MVNLWNFVKARKAETRAHFEIEDKHGIPFEPRKHYFQIKINEMYLAKQREWWVNYDPMVLVVSKYLYDKSQETIPAVVGPSLLKEFTEDVPQGFIIQDAPVTAMHPYQGGPFSLIVILSRIQKENMLKRF